MILFAEMGLPPGDFRRASGRTRTTTIRELVGESRLRGACVCGIGAKVGGREGWKRKYHLKSAFPARGD